MSEHFLFSYILYFFNKKALRQEKEIKAMTRIQFKALLLQSHELLNESKKYNFTKFNM